MLSHNGKQQQPLSLLRSHMNVGVRGQRKVGEHVEAHTKSQSFSLLQSEQMLTRGKQRTDSIVDWLLQSEWHNIPPTYCTTCRWKGSTFWDTDIQWWYFTHQLFWSCSGSAVLGVWKNTSSSTPEESQSCFHPPPQAFPLLIGCAQHAAWNTTRLDKVFLSMSQSGHLFHGLILMTLISWIFLLRH